MLIRALVIVMLLCSSGWGAVDLNGDADYITVSDTGLSLNRNFSIAGWVYADVSDTMAIIGHGCGAWLVRVVSGLKFNFLESNVQSLLTSSTNFSAQTWTHFVFVMNTTGGMGFYLNGVIDGTAGTSNNFSAVTCDAQIGIDEDCSGCGNANYFNGKLSDLAIWDIEISADDALKLAKSRGKRMPLQIKPSNLIAFWPLDDGVDGSILNTASNFYKDIDSTNHGTATDADGDSLNSAELILTYP